MAPQVNTTDRLLTRPEVAAVCNCSPMTTRRLELDPTSGFPRPVKLGGMVRWRLSDINAYLAALTPEVSAPSVMTLPAEPLA